MLFNQQRSETVFAANHVLPRAELVESFQTDRGACNLDFAAARARRLARIESEPNTADLREAAFERWIRAHAVLESVDDGLAGFLAWQVGEDERGDVGVGDEAVDGADAGVVDYDLGVGALGGDVED